MHISGRGSFRGVPFLVEDNQGVNGGKRLVKHEYPLRDDGLTEELGKRMRAYYVRCLVIGDNHVEQAKALIEALEKSGKGTLKHPYFGEVEVILEDYKATHSTAHQRVTRFDITFAPALDSNAPEIATDTAFSVLDGYANTLNSLADEFADGFETLSTIISSVVDNPVLSLMEATINVIDRIFQGVRAVIGSGDAVKSKILSIKNRINTLSLEPKMLALELQGLARLSLTGVQHNSHDFLPQKPPALQYTAINEAVKRSVLALSSTPEVTQSALSAIAVVQKQHALVGDIFTKYLSATTAHDHVQLLIAKSAYLIARLLNATLITEYGNTISVAVTQSLNQMGKQESAYLTVSGIESQADIRRYITDIDAQLERIALDAADAEQWQSYTALEQYRLTLLTDLRTRGEKLRNAKAIRLNDTFSALVIEHQYTGNATTWQRLALRNGIKHPLFCIGGTDIEVLQ